MYRKTSDYRTIVYPNTPEFKLVVDYVKGSWREGASFSEALELAEELDDLYCVDALNAAFVWLTDKKFVTFNTRTNTYLSTPRLKGLHERCCPRKKPVVRVASSNPRPVAVEQETCGPRLRLMMVAP